MLVMKGLSQFSTFATSHMSLGIEVPHHVKAAIVSNALSNQIACIKSREPIQLYNWLSCHTYVSIGSLVTWSVKPLKASLGGGMHSMTSAKE